MPTGTSTGMPPSAAPVSGLTFDAFVRLLRAQPDSLDAYFGEVGASIALPSTQATVHSRHLKVDGSHTPRVKALANRLAAEITNYSIPRSAIVEALAKADGQHDTKYVNILYRKANRLFTDLEKTGEGGELLLYLLAETYLRLPQILCKMPLKTSSSMHFHGADGVHGTFDPGTESLALYWGESKLHTTASDAINSCFDSLAHFLLPDGSSTSPQTRDLQLLTDNLDLDNPELEAAILRYLDPDDPKFNKLTYRGLALVGFDSPSYTPAHPPLTESHLATALLDATTSWHSSASHYITKNKLTDISIELFCVPFPSVSAFREAFLEELGIK